MEEEKLFDEDGDLLEEVYREVDENGATGEKAKAFLASEFANTTHGNYTAEILYFRASLNCEITIKKLN
jgi:hypothetical protein